MKKITLLGATLCSTICLLKPDFSVAQVGSLDLTFNSTGKAMTNVSTTNQGDEARAVAIQSDGKIVVAGHSFLGGSDYDFAIARYNPDGSLDTGFDTDGKVLTAINGINEDQAFAIAIQNDGKIVVAGYTSNGSAYSSVVVRYNSNGSLDTGFDSDGIAITTIGGIIDIAYSVTIQSDGKILTAGYSFNGTNNDFALVRYNSNGTLDTGFDTDGIVTTAVGSSVDMAYSMAIQSDGKIVVAGHSLISGNDYDFSVVRYNSNGSLDTSFDTDGKVITPVNGSDEDKAYSVALQSDGKIVLAGYTNNGASNKYALIRYNANGSLDTGFDTDGKATTVIGNMIDIAYSVALQSDGKILAAGYSFNTAVNNNDFALVRYNSDGSLDTGFDTDGIVTTAVGSSVDMAYSMAIQSDGKFVVAGHSLVGSDYDFSVVRYNHSSLGININKEDASEIALYPNPASNNLTVLTAHPTQISIYSINGIEMLSTTVLHEQLIDLSGFENGIYFIYTSNGQTMKFIKE